MLCAGAFTFTAGGQSGTFATNLKTTDTGELKNIVGQWSLPAELREVSGIALLEDNLMACVQDEEGAIYLYDLQQKAIKGKIPFAGPGDYEGIALNGSTAYILRSDGTVFEVADFRSGDPKVTKYASVLPEKQNTEGLTYDEKNNRLLIACKGHDEKLGDVKGIFEVSLEDKKMKTTPVISIPLNQDQIKPTGKKKKNRYAGLQPSSLEIHPETGELYLLDAVNNRLLIINEQGQIQKAVTLDKKLFKQAEGLTFGPNGELYIASESGGKKGNGLLVKFSEGL